MPRKISENIKSNHLKNIINNSDVIDEYLYDRNIDGMITNVKNQDPELSEIIETIDNLATFQNTMNETSIAVMPDVLSYNILLRNKLNDYLRKHSNDRNQFYLKVYDCYKDIVAKTDEDIKSVQKINPETNRDTYNFSDIFQNYVTNEINIELKHMDTTSDMGKQNSPDRIGYLFAKKAYITKLGLDYKAANTPELRQQILDEIYSDQLENNVRKFIDENPLAKEIYNKAKNESSLLADYVKNGDANHQISTFYREACHDAMDKKYNESYHLYEKESLTEEEKSQISKTADDLDTMKAFIYEINNNTLTDLTYHMYFDTTDIRAKAGIGQSLLPINLGDPRDPREIEYDNLKKAKESLIKEREQADEEISKIGQNDIEKARPIIAKSTKLFTEINKIDKQLSKDYSDLVEKENHPDVDAINAENARKSYEAKEKIAFDKENQNYLELKDKNDPESQKAALAIRLGREQREIAKRKNNNDYQALIAENENDLNNLTKSEYTYARKDYNFGEALAKSLNAKNQGKIDAATNTLNTINGAKNISIFSNYKPKTYKAELNKNNIKYSQFGIDLINKIENVLENNDNIEADIKPADSIINTDSLDNNKIKTDDILNESIKTNDNDLGDMFKDKIDDIKDIKDIQNKSRRYSTQNMIDTLKKNDRYIITGSKQYDDIIKLLTEISDIEKSIKTQKLSNQNTDKLRYDLVNKQKDAVISMNHYISRKKDEISDNGYEKANSRKRREAMERIRYNLSENIGRDMKNLTPDYKEKLTLHRDLYDISHEFHLANRNYKNSKSFNVLSQKADELVDMVDSGNKGPKDIINKEIKLFNNIVTYISKKKPSNINSSGDYKFVMSGNSNNEGKLFEPLGESEKKFKSTLEMYEKLGNKLINEIEVYAPERLNEFKNVLSKNNQLYKLNAKVERPNETNPYKEAKEKADKKLKEKTNANIIKRTKTSNNKNEKKEAITRSHTFKK
ncbi:MAG: hypothetical protein K6E10_08240 [Eubacterium sp.]|nr:hypothetical protein [Eubacterium sp.]